MKTVLKKTVAAVFVAGVLLAGCGKEPASEVPAAEEPAVPDTTAPPRQAPLRASASLVPIRGQSALGRVSFVTVKGGVRVTARLRGLREGRHGLHLYEKGTCNPTNPVKGTYVRLLGTLEADARGQVDFSAVDTLLALDGPASIVGKTLIVHERSDGTGGAQLACGVVEGERTLAAMAGSGKTVAEI